MPFISGITGSKGYAGIGVKGYDDEPEYKGTTMVFPQATAPVGWIKVTTDNDVGLRLTSASSGTLGTGGSNPFSSQYTPVTYTPQPGVASWPFSLDLHQSSVAEIPAHIHSAYYSASFNAGTNYSATSSPAWAPFGISTISVLASPLNPISFVSLAMTPYQAPLYSPTNTTLGDGHSHSFSGGFNATSSSSVALNVKYIYSIIAKRS
jgi:hypothetical protein